MQNIHKYNCKISLAILLTSMLAACGGGGSSSIDTDETEDQVTSNDDTTTVLDPDTEVVEGSVSGGTDSGGTVNTAGTGTCVNIVSPKVGDTGLIKNVTVLGEISSETEVRTTYTAVSNTSWSYDSVVASGVGLIEDQLPDGFEDLLPDNINLSDSLGQTLKTTETFTIANNFINITKSVTNSPAGLITVTYSPSRSAPFDKVCEGQIYTQKYTETTLSPGGTDTEIVDVKNTVEAVNVEKSSPAGTFNTVQVKSEGPKITLTTWVDIESSTIVIMESRNSDGDLLGTGTLISQEAP